MSFKRFAPIDIPKRALTPLTITKSGEYASPQSASNQSFTFRANKIEIKIDKFPGTACIYIGSAMDVQSPETLQSLNITHILNMTHECDHPESITKSNLTIKQIPLRDNSDENLLAIMDNAYSFIDGCINKGENILVHCFAGASRSPSVIIGYLIMRKIKMASAEFFANYKPDQIYKEMLDKVHGARPNTLPNFGFSIQLLELEKMEVDKAKNHLLIM